LKPEREARESGVGEVEGEAKARERSEGEVE
jgi:hypothetical protein